MQNESTDAINAVKADPKDVAKSLGLNLAVSQLGEVRQVTDRACVVTWTDCEEPHNTRSTSLQPGETFFYHDWNGSSCVFKEYTCQGAAEASSPTNVSAAGVATSEEASTYSCFRFFNPGNSRLGIYNNCSECKVLVYYWSGAGTYRYRVAGNSQTIVPFQGSSGYPLGEEDC